MVSPAIHSAPPLAKLSLVGADAQSFMQGYVTSDLDALAEDTAVPTACCNIKGRVLANGWVAGRADAVHLFVHENVAEALAAHLAKYLVFAKCSLERDARGFAIADAPAAGAIALEPFGAFLTPAGEDGCPALDRRCIDAGFGIVSAPLAEKFLPQMLGLADIGAVSFAKGCYLGQEVVARAQHLGEVKRRLARFRWRGALPAAGATTTPAGTVVHAAAESDDAGLALVVTAAGDVPLRGAGFDLTPVAEAPA